MAKKSSIDPSTQAVQDDTIMKSTDKQLAKSTVEAKKSPAKKSAAKKSAPQKATDAKAETTASDGNRKRASSRAAGMNTVAQLMTDVIHRVDSTASLNEAAQRMWENDIGVVPVVGMEGRVMGIVTDRDIAMAAYLQGRPLQDIGVQEVMVTQVQVVRPYEPAIEAASMMAQHQVRRLPVVDDEGLLVGMLSLNDLAEASGDTESDGITEHVVADTLRAVCAPRMVVEHFGEEAKA